CRPARARRCARCGRSSRPAPRRTPASRPRWTTWRPCCSTSSTAAARGASTRGRRIAGAPGWPPPAPPPRGGAAARGAGRRGRGPGRAGGGGGGGGALIDEIRAVTACAELLAGGLRAEQARVAWRPPLVRLAPDPRGDAANAEAVGRLLAARPRWVGVGRAAD